MLLAFNQDQFSLAKDEEIHIIHFYTCPAQYSLHHLYGYSAKSHKQYAYVSNYQ